MTFSPSCCYLYLIFFPPVEHKMGIFANFEDTGSLHVTLKMYLIPVKQKLCAVV